jgi:hypothetical protein
MGISQLSIRWDFYMRISQLSVSLTHMRFLYEDLPAINIAHSYEIFIWESLSYQYHRWASNSMNIQSSMSIKFDEHWIIDEHQIDEHSIIDEHQIDEHSIIDEHQIDEHSIIHLNWLWDIEFQHF